VDLGDDHFEAAHIDLIGRERQDVPTAPPADQAAIRAESPPQAVHQRPQVRRRVDAHFLAPQVTDKPPRRHGSPRLQCQTSEQRRLEQAMQDDRPIAGLNYDRPEQPDLDHCAQMLIGSRREYQGIVSPLSVA
jgi:hypothetical protein